ncbi:MAG: NAD(P)-binding domain-containing protein [Chloroflexota bacterium]|nr:NAD(P)-binding domain-containing protein [Chloroflexota bacterium]
MAQLDARPFPPGDYPVVVVGSGAGALQMSHALTLLGIQHAVISADPVPGGMFRRFPFFQRLLSWTKPYAPVERGTREYERYDWNSLTSDDPSLRALMPNLMDGTSYFPSREEMERNLATFAERANVRVRYDCRWESTARRDDGGFVLTTSDGDYRCRAAVFAVGLAEPWKPATPGMEAVPHYAETKPPESYAGKRIFIVGKQVSAFELASGLLPAARQIVLGSPSPAKLSVVTRNLVGVRARYLQPYEDYVLAGGLLVVDAAIEGIDRAGDGFAVRTRGSSDGVERTFDVEEVIAATGWVAPLRDLAAVGVATFGQSRLPSQTPFWESTTVPGIYFAGTITQGASGLKKHGVPSNSGAVHGHRYNARVLAREIARRHFGVEPARPSVAPDRVVDYLLDEVTFAPELWNQRSYLARVVSTDGDDAALRDEGILPLAYFVDREELDGIAITIEHNAEGLVYPAVYVRRDGRLSEHLLGDDPTYNFRSEAHRAALVGAMNERGVRFR